MDSVNNSMAVNALERALIISDKFRQVLTWSNKNQNKKREKNLLESELAQLRLALNYMKASPAIGQVIYKDESGYYRGRHEIIRETKLTWKERISVLLGNPIKFKTCLITEGVMGKVIEAASLSVGTQDRDVMQNSEKGENKEAEKEDLLEKVVESEPLEKQLKSDGSGDKSEAERESDKD